MSLKKQVLSGTIWTTSSMGVRALVQILRLSILARFLSKADFGLVAIAMMILGFTHIFTDLGVSVSLFSRKEITQKEYSSLYWVGLLLSFFLFILLVILSPLVAAFYHLDELKYLIPVMATDLVTASAGRQFRVFREKTLKFKSLAIIDIVSLLLSLGLAIILAIEGAGVYSLVLSTIFATFSAAVLLIVTGYKTHPLILYINLKEGRSFYKIGFYQTGSQIFDYLSSQIDILIIGKIMPASDLGVYNLVKQLVSRLYIIINPIVTQISIPVLASLQDDMKILKSKYLQMIQVVGYINFGIYALMALLAKELLIVFYGPAYQSGYLIFKILCIWGALLGVSNAVCTSVIFKGRTDLGFKRTLLRLIVNPLFVIAGAFYGLEGIVIGEACYAILFYAVDWKMLINPIMQNISFREYVGVSWKFFLIGIVIFAILEYCRDVLFAPPAHLIVNMIVWGFVFGVAYIAASEKTVSALVAYVKSR